MRRIRLIFGVLFFSLGMMPAVYSQSKQLRIYVVSSYHREYLWSQDTSKGFCAGLKDFKFIEDGRLINEYAAKDFLETGNIAIKKAWMDTKRKNKKEEIAATTESIVNDIKAFKPDLLLLGDDNATNFIGAHFFNTSLPVVFWGVDFNPLAYGYIDSLEHPGHNVTGVYQVGYFKESLDVLKKLFPGLKTFAILSDGSETGRAKSGVLVKLAEERKLPLQLAGQVATSSFSEWQDKIRELKDKVDAFFVVNHGTLRDDDGHPVDSLKAGAWYLRNVKKPEASPEKQFVQEGMLLSVDDSGFKQAYETVRMADAILHQGKSPANIPVIAPTRGSVMLNRERARALGLDLTQVDFVEEVIDKSAALTEYPQ